MRTNIKSLLGCQEGNIVILEKLPSKNGRTIVRCKCNICKREDYTAILSSIRQKKYKSCGCLQYRNNVNNPKWKGCGEISGAFFVKIKHSAIRRKISFNITIDYIWKLFLKQKSLCALSGLPLTFPRFLIDRASTASLDRIDSSIGYEKGNVQWVHKDINNMKQALSQKKFLEYCKIISKRNFHE